MTSIHHAHRRTSPPNVKKTAVRAQRPTPLTRSASSRSVSKATKAKKQADVVVDDEVQDDGMATSFLQFCAMCEKQILVPNNSILYCSESCRRKDSSPPLTSTSTSNPYATILSSTPSPYTPSLSDPLGPKPKPLIPRLQPTILPPPTTAITPSLAPLFKPDLDPTEWKPKLPNPFPASRPSDAATYLSLFHSAPPQPRRPVLPSRARTETTHSSTATPSLSHSPTSGSSREGSPVGTPDEFVARTLALRRDGAEGRKGGGLGMPLPWACGAEGLPGRESGGEGECEEEVAKGLGGGRDEGGEKGG